jgi:hypothetical protein
VGFNRNSFLLSYTTFTPQKEIDNIVDAHS